MKTIASALLILAPALLAGCAIFEPAPGYHGEPYHYYGPMPAPYIPEPLYVPRFVPHPYPGATGGHHERPRVHDRDREHDRRPGHSFDRDRNRDHDRDHDRDRPRTRDHR